MKILSVEAELLHAYRRTDVTQPIVVFRNLASPPKSYTEIILPNLFFILPCLFIEQLKNKQLKSVEFVGTEICFVTIVFYLKHQN